MDNIHMKRSLISLIFRETQIKDVTSLELGQLELKSQIITAIGKGVGKLERFYTGGGIFKMMHPLWKTAWQFLKW